MSFLDAIEKIDAAAASGSDELDLSGLDLTSDALQDLVNLLPHDIPNLRILRLGGNKIDQIPVGVEGMPGLEALENLTELDLTGNEELTSLPPGIGNLLNLQTLRLDSCSITELPESIGSMHGLRTLALGHCKLTRLPEAISDLQHLTELDLTGNEELTSLPPGIGNLQNLQTLRLDSCPIRELPDSIGNMHELRTLVLSGCNLSRLPDTIAGLQHLTELDLTGNEGLTILPPGIVELQNLQILKLNSCSFTELPESIGSLHQLRILAVRYCNLAYLPATISNLRHLTELDLAGNTTLASLPPGIGDLQNLQTLKLNSCAITELPESLGSLHQLQVLALRYCNIVHLPATISDLQNLTDLDLTGNTALTSLPPGIVALQNLQTLRLDSCPIRELPDSIGSLHALRTLDLEYGKVASLPATISGLQNLTELNIMSCQFNEVPREVFGLAKLEVLCLSHNPIRELSEDIGNLSNLILLRAEDMKIEELPKRLRDLPKLANLQLEDNDLSFEAEAFLYELYLERLRSGSSIGVTVSPISTAKMCLFLFGKTAEAIIADLEEWNIKTSGDEIVAGDEPGVDSNVMSPIRFHNDRGEPLTAAAVFKGFLENAVLMDRRLLPLQKPALQKFAASLMKKCTSEADTNDRKNVLQSIASTLGDCPTPVRSFLTQLYVGSMLENLTAYEQLDLQSKRMIERLAVEDLVSKNRLLNSAGAEMIEEMQALTGSIYNQSLPLYGEMREGVLVKTFIRDPRQHCYLPEMSGGSAVAWQRISPEQGLRFVRLLCIPGQPYLYWGNLQVYVLDVAKITEINENFLLDHGIVTEQSLRINALVEVFKTEIHKMEAYQELCCAYYDKVPPDLLRLEVLAAGVKNTLRIVDNPENPDNGKNLNDKLRECLQVVSMHLNSWFEFCRIAEQVSQQNSNDELLNMGSPSVGRKRTQSGDERSAQNTSPKRDESAVKRPRL